MNITAETIAKSLETSWKAAHGSRDGLDWTRRWMSVMDEIVGARTLAIWLNVDNLEEVLAEYRLLFDVSLELTGKEYF